jgi:DNA-binding response OmpR family regulator
MFTQSAHNSILLVDDEPDNLQPIVHFLEQSDYKIHISLTGKAALEILQHLVPDLIILDIILPDIDGYEICRQIKADPKLSDIPVLFMTSMTDVSDKVKGFDVGCQDYITKPIQFEELLARVKTHIRMRQMQKELFRFEKLQSLSVLAGGIAHDFNNILSIILGNVQLLKVNNENQSLIQSTEKAVMRAANLSKSLITFSKGGTPLLKKGDILPVIKESLAFILDTSDTTYAIDSEEDIPFLYFDKQQIGQAFNQMILNADQSMSHNGKILIKITQVEITQQKFALAKGKYVRITITDKGYGINHENLTRIFDPYFSTQDRGTQKGMGLGLAIAHSIIAQHKGFIEVESVPRKGSHFHVHLPVTKDLETPVSDIHADFAAIRRNQSTQLKVLIMDDELDICQMVKKVLARNNIVVDDTNNGEKAILKYKKAYENSHPYDALILDLSVKNGMGGVEAFKHIKSIDKHAKAIISSGYSHNPVMSNYKKYGFNNVLFKPYHLDELLNTLYQTIDIKPASLSQR